MFSKLALRNVRRSFRDYGVYLLTLTFGVCLFYTFNSLDGQGAMVYLAQNGNPIVDAIMIFMDIFSVFVAVVLADEPTGALDSKSSQLLLDRLEELNMELGATILMVTHDAFTASCCRRVVFLRDGKLFLELHRGNDSRKVFFKKIIQVVTEMGGGMADVL